MKSTQPLPPHQNITVWLEQSAVGVFDTQAKKTKRTRNYVIAKILEGIADRLTDPDADKLLQELGCAELKRI